tara:strand:+ start:1634 stop:2089 length:456 start_codon:yes stop_codon:yes gene_type:complete
MALTDKKYEKFYKTTGTGDDKVEAKNLLIAEELWDADRAIGMRDHIVNPELAPLIFQLQQMQDELDYLRTEIETNKSKTTFPGLGTSSTTALAGDTKLVLIGFNTTLAFGDMTSKTDPRTGKATYSITLTATRNFGGKTGLVTRSTTITLQ